MEMNRLRKKSIQLHEQHVLRNEVKLPHDAVMWDQQVLTRTAPSDFDSPDSNLVFTLIFGTRTAAPSDFDSSDSNLVFTLIFMDNLATLAANST